jgi:hypothetical protein
LNETALSGFGAEILEALGRHGVLVFRTTVLSDEPIDVPVS